jgi:hypothetical protein
MGMSREEEKRSLETFIKKVQNSNVRHVTKFPSFAV